MSDMGHARAPALLLSGLLACTLFSVSASISMVNTDGYFNCKCITPELEMYAENSSQCTDPDRPLAASNGHCYKPGFGGGVCRKWDENETPDCLGSNSPSWCNDSWCYVSRACRTTQNRSYLFVDGRHLNFSYGTCDELSEVNTASHQAALAGKSIRIHTLDEPPFTYIDRPADDPVGRGALIDFFTEMAQEARFTLVETPLMPYNGTSYEACIRDVGRGALDLCMGTFWQTPARMENCTFLDPLGVDNFMLVASQQDEDLDFSTRFLGIWRPFTGYLWLSIFGMTIFVATSIFLLERHGAGPDHPDFQTTSYVSGVTKSAYLAFLGFGGAAPVHHPKTLSGRLMLLAFAAFVMVGVSGYTASLANHMIVKNTPKASVSDLNDLIKKSKKVCVTATIMPTILHVKPQLYGLLVPVPSQNKIFQAMDNGTCDAVLDGNHFAKRTLTQSRHCRKTIVGEVIKSMMLSQPVNSRLAQDLSYWMVKLRSEDRLQQLLLKYSLPNHCEAVEEEKETDRLDVKDFVGSYFLVGLVAVFSFGYRCCIWAMVSRGILRSHSLTGEICKTEEGLTEVIGNILGTPGSSTADGGHDAQRV